MKCRFRHLRAFVAVAEHGSTSAAARALNLSQPSVSVTIRELESILTAQLFRRDPPKGLVLTSFGRRKLAAARHLLAEAETFERAGEGPDRPSGPVSFGYFTTLGPQHVPAILKRASLELPEVTVDPVEADLEELHRLLDSGRIELGLTYDVGLSGQVETEPVASFAPYALLPDGHRLAKAEKIKLADLAKEPFILVDLPHSRDFLLSVFRAQGFSPHIAHRTRSIEMVRGLVANGMGVSLLVTRPRSDQAYDGGYVVARPLADLPPSQRVLLARPAGIRPTEATAAFAGIIRSHYKDARP